VASGVIGSFIPRPTPNPATGVDELVIVEPDGRPLAVEGV
jgi:hypothetical protein